MIETRKRIAAIAATVSVASSLAATTTAESRHWDDTASAVVTTLAEAKDSKTRDDGARSSATSSPGATVPTINKATPAPRPLWNEKDKGLQEPRR